MGCQGSKEARQLVHVTKEALSEKVLAFLDNWNKDYQGSDRELDYSNELIFLRIRTQKNEIMVAPDVDYYLVVVQDIVESISS